MNYDKIREATQENDENPALFLPRLTEAVPKYTNLDISTPAGLLYLQVPFISQSVPDIHPKLYAPVRKGPQNPSARSSRNSL